MDANIARFRDQVAPLMADWKSIDLRVVASRSDDKWIYGVIKAVLDSSNTTAPTRQDLPSLDGLLVIHERWNIARLDELLDSLSSYYLDVQGHKLLVENANTNPKMNYSFESMNRKDSIQRLGISSYALYLQSWMGQPMFDNDIRLALDSRLRVSEHPWDGIEDVLMNFVRVSPNYLRSMPTKLVEVIAPVGVWTTDASFTDQNGIMVNVEKAPTLSVKDLGLSSIGHVAGEDEVRLQKVEKSVVDETHLSFMASFPKIVQSATIILTYHGLDVDRIELLGKALRGKNPRLAVLEQGKPGEFLASLKNGKDKLFEDRISLLFHILGLSPGYYGRAYQPNADILAFPDSEEWVLNIECTTEEIDLNNKLSKLATRTKLLTASMAGVTVHPVVVTRFSRILINKSEMDKAQTEGISIITSDEFEVLIQMAVRSAKAIEVRDYVLTLVPGSGEGWMSGFSK